MTLEHPGQRHGGIDYDEGLVTRSLTPRSQASLTHEVSDLVIRNTTDPRKRLQGCHRSRHALGRLDAVGNQIGHGPQQARQLGLGLEGAAAVMTLSGRRG